MWRIVLFVFAILNVGLAKYMWFLPMHWYENTPGVAAMGPFNVHFIRDVALAYFVSGGALFYGAWKRNRTAAVFGAMWICAHAVFHIWIWLAMRGMAFDQVALVNLVGIQIPAWLALIGALKFKADATS